MKNSFKFSLVAAAVVVSIAPMLSVAVDTYDIYWDSNKAVYSKNGGDNQDIEAFFDNGELQNQDNNKITINLDSNTFDNSVFGGLNFISDIFNNNITFQSGIINGKLMGGSSSFGKVFNNTIVVKNSEVKSDIIGGNGDSSEVSGNKIILENAKAKLVYGGYSSGSGKVSGNKVIINDSTIGDGKSGKVYGGYGNDNGSVENNEVIIQGGTFDYIYGGHSKSSESKFNKVTIQNANAGYIYGGSAWRNASDNEIIIKNSTTGGIDGGFSMYSGDASRNKIYISSSSVGGIYGGLSNTGNAIDNTITLQIDTTKRPTNISGAIYGGFVGEPINQDCKTGNTLNIGESQFLPLTNMNLLKAKNIYNFETINFYLPNSVSNGQVALSLSDTKPTDLTNVKVNAYLSNASNLTKDSKIHLIQVPDGGAIENFNEANGNANLSNVNIAGLINVTGKIAVDNTAKNLDLTFNGDPSGGGSGGGSTGGGTGGATANANSKQLLENSLAGMIAVNESINNLVSNLDNLGSNANSGS
ncbi:MAG: hypothetical protein J6M21_02250, partial [Campylobacter sp.]|nr:hypothetical protein [Campylobacter sp.]